MDQDPTAPWQRLLAEVDAAAERYRADGVETVAVEPTDVSVAGEPPGLVLVVPDEEHAVVAELAASGEFAAADTLVEATEDVVLVAVAFERADGGAAILLPCYYERTPDEEGVLRDHRGPLGVRVRGLAATGVVAFAHDEPAALFTEKRFDAE
jgi:hypothetical protein